ncbi:MAG: 2-octaprenyl-6-methoxyphenyl hydroxylase [Pasteurella oralis]|uniref:2-octaprenyl-6-methoxyphenyl hydroxylase n=1 Tax=Pasteurella oralis TaxID=1071947 RepID=UPI0027114AF9|nr:2-octaprenyl-6-methoxyphenyl hydroxylase [Pasteurella oralis]
MSQETNYDVIIVGGAMTGATLALALSDQTAGKIKIAVLEKQVSHQHQQRGFDARCIALSDGSCQRLAQINLPTGQTLWQQFQPIITPIKKIHVSDKGHSGLTEFSAQEFHLSQLGAVIELQATGRILLNAIHQYPNINYFAPVDITQIEHDTEQVKISLKNDRTLSTKLLIGADGTQSLVASSVNISQNLVRQYHQTAIITNVLPQQVHQYRAFERFTDEGPLALLPMPNNLMSLVWCVQDPEPLIRCDEAQFLLALQHRFGWRLGKLLQCGQRFTYPLNLYQAEQHIQPRIALIGNAAQTLHPIAGQGFNLGIRDVMQLASLVATKYQQQQDIGTYQNLIPYAIERQQDQQQIINLTDGLLSIFANNLLPLQISRTLGLMALSQSRLLRQYFAKPTLGWK